MTLSEKLCQLRKDRGITQDEAAEALGVSRQAISKWEVGTGIPTLDNLVAVSRFYGVTLDSLASESSPLEPLAKPEQEPEIPPAPEAAEAPYNYTPPPQVQPVCLPKPSKPDVGVCAAILILAGVFGRALDYLLTAACNRLLIDNGVVAVGFAPLLISLTGIISVIPTFIAYSLLFRCPSHGAGTSFARILGVSIISRALSFAMYRFLPINPLSAVIGGAITTAAYLLMYLAAAGCEGFKGRKRSVKRALAIFYAAYFLYLVLSGLANLVVNKYCLDRLLSDTVTGMTAGRVLYIATVAGNILGFVMGTCAKSIVTAGFYCGKEESGS